VDGGGGGSFRAVLFCMWASQPIPRKTTKKGGGEEFLSLRSLEMIRDCLLCSVSNPDPGGQK
jgi:hypothetical protein